MKDKKEIPAGKGIAFNIDEPMGPEDLDILIRLLEALKISWERSPLMQGKVGQFKVFIEEEKVLKCSLETI